jgi:hypothetical protein
VPETGEEQQKPSFVRLIKELYLLIIALGGREMNLTVAPIIFTGLEVDKQ